MWVLFDGKEMSDKYLRAKSRMLRFELGLKERAEALMKSCRCCSSVYCTQMSKVPHQKAGMFERPIHVNINTSTLQNNA